MIKLLVIVTLFASLVATTLAIMTSVAKEHARFVLRANTTINLLTVTFGQILRASTVQTMTTFLTAR